MSEFPSPALKAAIERARELAVADTMQTGVVAEQEFNSDIYGDGCRFFRILWHGEAEDNEAAHLQKLADHVLAVAAGRPIQFIALFLPKALEGGWQRKWGPLESVRRISFRHPGNDQMFICADVMVRFS
jgi:hypothetical protein